MAARLAAAAEQMDNWHGVELNLSCPNVAEGGHDFGRDPGTVAACVDAARDHLPDRALLVKLTPNVTDIAQMAGAVVDASFMSARALSDFLAKQIEETKAEAASLYQSLPDLPLIDTSSWLPDWVTGAEG